MAETFYDLLVEAAQTSPDLPVLCYPSSAKRAYVPEGAEYSYRTALETVDSLAELYTAAGYQPGHRVAIAAGNRPEHFWHLLALNKIGVTLVTLNPDYTKNEFSFGINFPQCSLVLASSENMARIEEAVGSLDAPVPVLDVEALPARFPQPVHAPVEAPEKVSERIALIIYTSGTTGRPKGCLISNESCLAAGQSYGTADGLMALHPGQDRIYTPLPAFHMNTSVYTLSCILRLRNCLIVQARFSISSWWSDLVETGATAVHYLGIIPPLLVKSPADPNERRHKVRFGTGAGVDPAVREAFEKRFGFPLVEAWGMTETSRSIQNSRLPRCLEPRAFGRPRDPWEVRIEDESGDPVPFGAPGELLVRASGPNPRAGFFSGYLNLPEETEHAWRNGWFHTGDIVYQREDQMMFFVDRRKNIVRRSGENIAAAEVEDALLALPEVQGAAVLAVEDELHDEEVMAAIVAMEGVSRTRQGAEAIQAALVDRIGNAKLPAWIVFVDELPVTGTQKVQKGAIFEEGQDPRRDPRSIDLRETKRGLRTAVAG